MAPRRIFAGFFVFLFVAVSLPAFFVYSLSKTFFQGAFYQGPVSKNAYDFTVSSVANAIYRQDRTLQSKFKASDIEQKLREHFTLELFQDITSQLGQSIETLKNEPQKPVSVNLKIFRDSALDAANDLVSVLFQSIPQCQTHELPEVNEESIPTCIPQNLEFVDVAQPLSNQFESAVYAAFPEQILIDLNASSGFNNQLLFTIFSGVDPLKVVFLAVLLIFTVLIAVFSYRSLSLMLKYEAAAFGLAGLGGFLLSFSYALISSTIIENFDQKNLLVNFVDKDAFKLFLDALISYPMMEMQKIALLFLIIGVLLLLTQFIFQRFTKQAHVH